MGRRPRVAVPDYTDADVADAVRRIHAMRVDAHDPDLDFFPVRVREARDPDDEIPLDPEMVDAVLDYMSSHRNVEDWALAAELPERALLTQYQHQQNEIKYRRDVLAILNIAHDLKVPPRKYGWRIGLPSRAAVWNRRTRETIDLRRYDEAAPTRRQTDDDARMERWLEEHHRDLLAVAEMLVDHRDRLLLLVPAGEQRTELAHAIDQAGTAMSARPSRLLAGSIAYALFFLSQDGPVRRAADPDVREVIQRGVRLRDGYEHLREALRRGS